jgi:beta-galactosidase
VNLLAFSAKARIEDFSIRTLLDRSYQDAVLSVTLNVHAEVDTEVILELSDAGGHLIKASSSVIHGGAQVFKQDLNIQNPIKWTAEYPYLYRLSLTLSHQSKVVQTQSHCVGFRCVEIKNGNLTVNGVPLLLKGVNRHDHHPRHGRSVPIEFIRNDLVLMKRHNINAVRCSHYPSSPQLYAMCDELGLWVVDEADLECHGFSEAIERASADLVKLPYFKLKVIIAAQAAAFTSDNPTWEAAYLDRMSAMIERDKNHPSVIMWSLGNEAFYGRNHKAMYRLGHKLDPTRPIHYEGDVEAESADVFSYMYYDIAKLDELAQVEGDEFKKPIILCEYAHAMGNGPGALEDYQKLFRKHRRLQGGFIWEWANHGIWKEDADSKTGYYAYGGDFGDEPNDSTFVMDGLVYSDHTPTPGLHEAKRVFEPIKVTLKGNDLIIHNMLDFEDLSSLMANLEVWTLPLSTRSSRKVLFEGLLAVPTVIAGQTVSIPIPEMIKPDGNHETWLSISFKLRSANSWGASGHEVAWSQHQLPYTQLRSLAETEFPGMSSNGLETSENLKNIEIRHPNFAISISKRFGGITSWTFKGAALISPGQGPSVTVWRAPTDNDLGADANEWKRYGLHKMTHSIRSVRILESNDKSVTIQINSFLAPPVLAWKLIVKQIYSIGNDGTVKISTHVLPTGKFPPTIPRIGLSAELPGHLANVTWAGLGPGESYCDKKTAQKVNVYSKSVEDMHTLYEVPQENGNRTDTRWAAMTGPSGIGLAVKRIGTFHTQNTSKKPDEHDAEMFDFSAQHYDVDDLEQAQHPTELRKRDGVFFRIDAAHHGLGTGSCGPGVQPQYKLQTQEIEFTFLMEPLEGKHEA